MRSRKAAYAQARARFQPEVVDYRSLEAKAVGAAIRSRREYLNLNQKQMAKLVGITPAAACRIEKGQAMPKPSTIAQMCTALQCSLTQLIYPVSFKQADNTASASFGRIGLKR